MRHGRGWVNPWGFPAIASRKRHAPEVSRAASGTCAVPLGRSAGQQVDKRARRTRPATRWKYGHVRVPQARGSQAHGKEFSHFITRIAFSPRKWMLISISGARAINSFLTRRIGSGGPTAGAAHPKPLSSRAFVGYVIPREIVQYTAWPLFAAAYRRMAQPMLSHSHRADAAPVVVPRAIAAVSRGRHEPTSLRRSERQ